MKKRPVPEIAVDLAPPERGAISNISLTPTRLDLLYPDLPVTRRGEEPGDVQVRVAFGILTGTPGQYELEFNECICVIEGTRERQHREFGIMADTLGSQCPAHEGRPRTVASVISWGLYPGAAGHWLRDLVEAAGPQSQYWVAFLGPGEPRCMYGSVSQSVYQQLCTDIKAAKSNSMDIADVFRNFRRAVPMLDSDVHAHMLVTTRFHPADPAGYAPWREPSEDEIVI